MRLLWLIFLLAGTAFATLPDLPESAAQSVPLPACSLRQRLGLPVPTAHYDHLYAWRKGSELLALEFRRENTVDAYANLLLRYRGGQLTFVHEYDWGEAGQAGRTWTLRGGKVVKAEAYANVLGKDSRHSIALNTLPKLYLERPSTAWYRKVICANIRSIRGLTVSRQS